MRRPRTSKLRCRTAATASNDPKAIHAVTKPLPDPMPLELQIIRASEFIRLGAQGHFDLAASKAALAELVGACRKRGLNQALMDLRALQPGPKPVFSPADLIALVNTFREIGFTHQQRLAILYHSDPHHRARLFAFLSTVRGWSVRAFGDFEAALLWLSSTEEDAAQLSRRPAGKRIPVRDLKREANPPAPPALLPGRQERETSGRKRAVSAMRRAGCSRQRPVSRRSRLSQTMKVKRTTNTPIERQA